jgi:SH3-like domain-containing protein
VLAGGCLLALGRHDRFRVALLVGAAVGVAAVATSAFNAAATVSVLSESIALRQASASVSPVAGADPLFQVPAAAEVRVLDRHAGFRLIRDSQGREGWVAANDLAAVIPGQADQG